LIIDEKIADDIIDILDRATKTGVRAAVGKKVRLIKEAAAAR